MTDYSKLGYSSKLINLKSPIVSPLGQDSLRFDGRFVDTGVQNIKDNTITSSKIANGAVTQAKIATNSVSGSHVINGGLGSDDMAAGNIVGSHLGGSAVVGTNIALNAVTNTKINDYDLAKGTGLSLTITNTGTAGTWNSTSRFATGTALGTSGTIPVEQAGGTINLIFIGGLFTGTS